MSKFVEIKAAELEGNFFKRIGEDWMLIAAEKDGRVSMMTASWGGVGVYCHKPVAYSYIRPQRFTKGLVDAAEGFSITFFPESYREQLNFCGTKSGRDYEKVKECGFEILHSDGIPYFAQADTAFICKPIVVQELVQGAFKNRDVLPEVYAQQDFHTLYISEIVQALVRG